MLKTIINLDIRLLNFFRNLIDPTNNLAVKSIMFFSDFWVILVALLLVWLWFYWVYKKDDTKKENALLIFYSIIFSFIIYMLLNVGLPIRPRPETVTSIRPLVDHLPDNSFPSWHWIFAWAAVIACFRFLKRKDISIYILFFSIIMLLSRVISWVHYPTDVIVWFLLWLLFWFTFIKLSDSKIVRQYLLPYPIKFFKLLKL